MKIKPFCFIIMSLMFLLFVTGCTRYKTEFVEKKLDEYESSVAKITEDYFPDKIFSEREDLHTFVNLWYSKHLSALQELSIYNRRSDHAKTIFRFTWLRTFHHPICIRLEIQSDGKGKLYSKMTSGAGGYKPGVLKINNTEDIDKTEIDKFLKMVKEEEFWSLPSRAEEDMGLDGAQWIIEGLHGGKYHIVDRWSPEEGPVRKIAMYLLGLSRLKDALGAGCIY